MIGNKRAKIMCILHFLSEMINKSGISDLTSFTIRTQYYLNLITFKIGFYAYFYSAGSFPTDFFRGCEFERLQESISTVNERSHQ